MILTILSFILSLPSQCYELALINELPAFTYYQASVISYIYIYIYIYIFVYIDDIHIYMDNIQTISLYQFDIWNNDNILHNFSIYTYKLYTCKLSIKKNYILVSGKHINKLDLNQEK